MLTEQECTGCNQTLPISDFYRAGSGAYRKLCKGCTNKKQCPSCDTKKPTTQFYKGSSSCKSCEKERKKKNRKTKGKPQTDWSVSTESLEEMAADLLQTASNYKSHSKTCHCCQEKKHLEDFRLEKKNKDGYATDCIRCENIEKYNPDEAVLLMLAGKDEFEILFNLELEKLEQGDHPNEVHTDNRVHPE